MRQHRNATAAAILIASLLVLLIGLPASAQNQQQLVGVGVMIRVDDTGGVWIGKVLPDGPAARAGVKDGDELLAIDGKSIADVAPDEVTAMLRGAEGTDIALTVRTQGSKARKLSMQRARITIPPDDQQRQPPPANQPGKNPLDRGDRAANPLDRGGKKSNPLDRGQSNDGQQNDGQRNDGQRNDGQRNDGQRNDGQPPKRPSAGLGAMRFQRVAIKDPGINNIEAATFLIPVGWQMEGGMKWFNDYSVLANLLLKITDPQTGVQLEFLPVQNFVYLPRPVVQMQQGTNYMGNIVWSPVTDLNQFVQTFYTREALPHLRNARPISVTEQPKVEETVQKAWGGQARVISGKVRYEFQNRNGEPWQEDLYLTIVYNEYPDSTFWSVASSYSFRAPKGKLDEVTPILATTINTYRLTPDWYGGYMYVQKLFQNRMNQGIKDAAAISATVTKNSEEIRKMFSESYKQQQDSQDRLSESRSETMRGVETYKDPIGGRPVELPSGYNDAWVNAKGEYILSNEAGYDPNVGDTTTWQRMPRRGE